MTSSTAVASPAAHPETAVSSCNVTAIKAASNSNIRNKTSATRSRGVILPWDCKLALLQEYKNAKGNLLIPRNYLDPSSGYQLGRLVYRLRQGKARLSPEQVAALNALGFVWNRSPCTTWNKWFDLLCEYQREFGHVCPTHKQLYKNQKLGQWVMQQRVMYERKQKQLAGQLQSGVTSISQDRIDRLNSIGFLWRLSTSRKEVVMNSSNTNNNSVNLAENQQPSQEDATASVAVVSSLSEEDVANLGQDLNASLANAGASSSLMDVTIQCLLQDAVKEMEATASTATVTATASVTTPITTRKKKRSFSSSPRCRKKAKKTSTMKAVPCSSPSSSDLTTMATNTPSSTPPMSLTEEQDLVSFLDTLPQHAAEDAVILAASAVPQVPTSSSSSHLFHHQQEDDAAVVSSDSSAASETEDHEETDSCSGGSSAAAAPRSLSLKHKTTSVDGLSRSLSVTFAEDVQVQILTDNEQQQRQQDSVPDSSPSWNEKEKMLFIQNFFD